MQDQHSQAAAAMCMYWPRRPIACGTWCLLGSGQVLLSGGAGPQVHGRHCKLTPACAAHTSLIASMRMSRDGLTRQDVHCEHSLGLDSANKLRSHAFAGRVICCWARHRRRCNSWTSEHRRPHRLASLAVGEHRQQRENLGSLLPSVAGLQSGWMCDVQSPCVR